MEHCLERIGFHRLGSTHAAQMHRRPSLGSILRLLGHWLWCEHGTMQLLQIVQWLSCSIGSCVFVGNMMLLLLVDSWFYGWSCIGDCICTAYCGCCNARAILQQQSWTVSRMFCCWVSWPKIRRSRSLINPPLTPWSPMVHKPTVRHLKNLQATTDDYCWFCALVGSSPMLYQTVVALSHL